MESMHFNKGFHAKTLFEPLIYVSSTCVGIVDVLSNFIPLSQLCHVLSKVEKTKETKDFSYRPCYYNHIPKKNLTLPHEKIPWLFLEISISPFFPNQVSKLVSSDNKVLF